jgi:predicted nucleic acid-binding protein
MASFRRRENIKHMIDPAWGPFLFDTSAESWLARTPLAAAQAWFQKYAERFPVHVSAVTVMERARGYALLWRRESGERRRQIESARIAYQRTLGQVWPVDIAIAIVAGEIMALLPQPPTPVKRSHKFTESRQERLTRWRFDAMIAATALVTRMPLVHNNAGDFEAIRSAVEIDPARFPGLGPLELVRCGTLV